MKKLFLCIFGLLFTNLFSSDHQFTGTHYIASYFDCNHAALIQETAQILRHDLKITRTEQVVIIGILKGPICIDAETAKGAKIWNHANVLGLSLRLISPATLKEILTAWLDTPYSTDEWNLKQIERINLYESNHYNHSIDV